MKGRALTPFHIGTCEVPNRFVMTACNLGWCEGGFVTQKVVDFYRQRARGHVGLIIAGAAGVDPLRVNQAGMMQICSDEYLPNLRQLTFAVHNQGSRIFAQLMHAGAYARRSEHGGITAVAPSAGISAFTHEEAQELTQEQIGEIIEYFRDAACRAKDAGFDGVELIASAGYLIAQFLSPATNRRCDQYGGNFENRSRFLLEIIDAVREACGSFPVMVRLSGSDFVEGGREPSETLALARLLDGKVDAVDITGGWHESHIPQITYNVPRGMYLYLAAAIKKSVGIPVIGCNRLDASHAVKAVEEDLVDAAGMLRAFIAEPFLVSKIEEHREQLIRPCLSCNQLCLDSIFSGKGLGCVVNPFVGREGEPLKKREYGKRILVIGAGISGLGYAAMTAKENNVTVWEKSDHYGGVGNLVARIPYREDIADYIKYLYEKCRYLDVRFEWNHDADPDELRRVVRNGIYDKVIIAAGSYKKRLEYPTAEGTCIMTAEECLSSERLSGRRIVVIGSGYRAIQTAQYCLQTEKDGDRQLAFLQRYESSQTAFAKEAMGWQDASVTILSPAAVAGSGFGISTRWMMLSDVREQGVKIVTGAFIRRIEKDRVLYQLGDGSEQEIPADVVIACEGWIKNGKFSCFPDCDIDEITVIGDAMRPMTIAGAVRESFDSAWSMSV